MTQRMTTPDHLVIYAVYFRLPQYIIKRHLVTFEGLGVAKLLPLEATRRTS